MLIREHAPLAPLTTLGVGGPARYFTEASTESDVIEAVEFARSRALPLFVLGGGSNVVIADTGFAGLVLKIAISDFAVSTAPHGIVTFVTGAGYDWDALVAGDGRGGLRWPGMPEWNSRHRRRHARAKRRRLWPGSLRHDPGSARA